MADQPVRLKKSSQVHEATYDPSTKRCSVVLNGATVAYHQVEPQTIAEWEKADSPGKYFHEFIRGPKDNPKHKFSRVR
jgi:hypothetical protein